MNLGIDFGSTYTLVSTYREDKGHPVLINADAKNGASIPTVLSYDEYDGFTSYGSDAKEQTGDNDTRVFKAFKMLLNEKNQQFIEDRQYDKEYTPRWAAEEFLKSVITRSKNKSNADSVDKLVIGAPEVWFRHFNTLSGRALLRDICGDIEGVEKDGVRIVSEPVLASAYVAYNYMRAKGTPFEGVILVVDYGGGTLDLSLAEVSKGSANNKMEIRMLTSNGAGENTDHSIGNAGIVYMESLMEYVIRKNTPDKVDSILGTPVFDKAVNDLESQLRINTDIIEEVLRKESLEDEDAIEELDEQILKGRAISCGKEKYRVTYADIVNVYNTTIREVFDRTMEDIIRWAKEKKNLDLLRSHGDKFKIALVGGFGNFYPVKHQMEEKFDFGPGDERSKDIFDDEDDKESAISLGAGLVASDIIGIVNTAPYAIGLKSKIGSNEYVDYMVDYREEIDLDKPMYASDEAGNPIPFIISENKLQKFEIDYGDISGGKKTMNPKKGFQKKLTGLVKNDNHTCFIGVSFSSSDVLRLHIKELETSGSKTVMIEREPIEIGQFDDFFEEIK